MLTQCVRGFTVVKKYRVGTRNYMIRIAASSQEHVLECITRKATRPENDMILVLVSKWNWFLGRCSKKTGFQWGMGVDLILVQGSELTRFRAGVEHDLV